MSDNYEFTKSSIPQAIDDYSPYIDKQSNNYINDINSGVYTNNSLSLVTFDLGQIYNSNTLCLLVYNSLLPLRPCKPAFYLFQFFCIHHHQVLGDREFFVLASSGLLFVPCDVYII